MAGPGREHPPAGGTAPLSSSPQLEQGHHHHLPPAMKRGDTWPSPATPQTCGCHLSRACPQLCYGLGGSLDINSALGTRGLTCTLNQSDHPEDSPLTVEAATDVQRRLNLSLVSAGGSTWVVRPHLPSHPPPPKLGSPTPALFSKTGAGVDEHPCSQWQLLHFQRGQAFVWCAVWSVGGRGQW